MNVFAVPVFIHGHIYHIRLQSAPGMWDAARESFKCTIINLQIVTEVVHEFPNGKLCITNNTLKWKKYPFSDNSHCPSKIALLATSQSLIGDSQLITARTDGCIYWSCSSTYFSSLNDTDCQIWPACVMDSEEPMTQVSLQPLSEICIPSPINGK